MEIEYEVLPEDLIEYNITLQLTPARRRKRLKGILRFSLLIGVCGLVIILSGEPTKFQWGVAFLVLAVIVPVFSLPLFGRQFMRRKLIQFFPANAKGAIYGWRKTTIDADRILQMGEFMVAGWKWPAVERIEASEHSVLFFISDAVALFVPRRAFASEANVQEFIAAAERFRQSACGMG